jgi:DNA polymerase III subunit delta'
MEQADFNWPLIGNAKIKKFLEISIANKQLAGSYIFCGASDLGKTTTARYFANILLCQRNSAELLGPPCGDCPVCLLFVKGEKEKNFDLSQVHADYHYLKREDDKKNIGIGQVRELVDQLNMASFLNSYKVGIIKEAENLSLEAANALLKSLEEPKLKVVFILTVSSLDALPATIVSRSVILRFNPVPSGTIYDFLVKERKTPRTLARQISHQALGRPALAIKFLEDKTYFHKYQAVAETFFEMESQNYAERFKALEKLLDIKNTQEQAKEAKRILGLWQSALRDIMLYSCGQADLIQNFSAIKSLERWSKIYKP